MPAAPESFARIAVIGFGEAGPIFARAFLDAGVPAVSTYDILIDDPATAPAHRDKAAALGVTACNSSPDAVAGADLVLSTVTADQTVAAAAAAGPAMGAGQVYLDLNSGAPETKKRAAAAVEAKGAVFVEGVAMDTVPNFGAKVPLLIAGPGAGGLAEALNAMGLRVEALGEELGLASATKMLRSVLIKGFAALFGESMLAAGKLGVQDRIVASLYETFPGLDWRQVIGYYLSRSALHARRQAAEMRDSAATVESLGVTPHMTEGTAARLQWLADLGVPDIYAAEGDPTIEDFLRVVGLAEKRTADK